MDLVDYGFSRYKLQSVILRNERSLNCGIHTPIDKDSSLRLE